MTSVLNDPLTRTTANSWGTSPDGHVWDPLDIPNATIPAYVNGSYGILRAPNMSGWTSQAVEDLPDSALSGEFSIAYTFQVDQVLYGVSELGPETPGVGFEGLGAANSNWRHGFEFAYPTFGYDLGVYFEHNTNGVPLDPAYHDAFQIFSIGPDGDTGLIALPDGSLVYGHRYGVLLVASAAAGTLALRLWDTAFAPGPWTFEMPPGVIPPLSSFEMPPGAPGNPWLFSTGMTGECQCAGYNPGFDLSMGGLVIDAGAVPVPVPAPLPALESGPFIKASGRAEL